MWLFDPYRTLASWARYYEHRPILTPSGKLDLFAEFVT
jgi:hypothetical protein